tara:strand:- start:332 stop:1171 length:840 start_codon:yes stop_codon:yes gene_type:complete
MDIQKFNYEMLDECKHAPAVILASSRGGGKSVLLLSLMKYLDKRFKFSNIFAFSQTDKISNSLPFMIQDNIYDNLDNLSKILEIRIENKTPPEKLPYICLIFNDIASLRENGRSIKNSESLEKVFSMGRHKRIVCVCLIQKLTMLNPLIRLNSDATFLWVAKSHAVKQKIKDEYLGLARNKKESEEIYEQIFNGTPYNAMVVLQFKQGVTQLNDYVYEFVAPFPPPKWKSRSLKNVNKYNKKVNKLLEQQKNNIVLNYNEVKTNPTLRRSNRTRKKISR